MGNQCSWSWRSAVNASDAVELPLAKYDSCRSVEHALYRDWMWTALTRCASNDYDNLHAHTFGHWNTVTTSYNTEWLILTLNSTRHLFVVLFRFIFIVETLDPMNESAYLLFEEFVTNWWQPRNIFHFPAALSHHSALQCGFLSRDIRSARRFGSLAIPHLFLVFFVCNPWDLYYQG